MVHRRGFTLIELLVVIFIIVLVSVVALPTILPALNHREVSEAARILQGALVGARDKAIHDGAPSGIRLLPDPGFGPGLNSTATGAINPYSILAYNRIIPIGPAPEYTTGYCLPTTLALGTGLYTPTYKNATVGNTGQAFSTQPYGLMLLEAAADVSKTPPAPNPPTSWYWNVRVGDKIQLNNAGPWYTIVGPMIVPPQGATIGGTFYSNPELFVNAGPPGAPADLATVLPLLTYTYNTLDPMGNPTTATAQFSAEYLILANGKDDNLNGWVDEGFDGVDNDGDGLFEESSCTQSAMSAATLSAGIPTGEWEIEAWAGSTLDNEQGSTPYTIRRRPAPSPGSREIALPTSMVIDGTSMFLANPERSRLPLSPQTQFTGYVDIVLNPDGTVLPTVDYGAPSSFGMSQAFYHFWLAERQDLAAVAFTTSGTTTTLTPIQTIGSVSHYLPIAQPGGSNAGTYTGPFLKGRYSVVSLATRTGQISVNEEPPFFLDTSSGYTNSPDTGATYNPVYPFIQAEQGVNGGQ